MPLESVPDRRLICVSDGCGGGHPGGERHDRCVQKASVRLLLTSAGVKNPSIRDALVDLLGKPIAESSALTGCSPMKGKLIKLPVMIGTVAAAALMMGAPAMAATPATAAPRPVVAKAASPNTEYELFFGYYQEFQACDDE